MRYTKLMYATVLGALCTPMANAVPTAEEAAQLGKTLTPFGAIKAGNADGSIPEWTGGMCKMPANYKPRRGLAAGGAPYVDPFADEKPLFKITAADVAKYGDKIDEGTKEMFKRNPQTFRMDVYKTHRTACFPQWAYDNTIKNVMKPRLLSVDTVPSLSADTKGQIPFPIPKNGLEVMWNAALKFGAPYTKYHLGQTMVDSAGNRILTSVQVIEDEKPYWDNTLGPLSENQYYWTILAQTPYPPNQVGTLQMRLQYLRKDLKGAPAYSYTPGQRRVRLAPEFAYDGVSTTSGGVLIYDEINGFDGKMDRFDFKLVGRKEMYMPYNTNKLWIADADKAAGPKHVNSDLLRWELHRVWVVEATLKPGERHVEKKKMFYIDEDSWNIIDYSGWDHAGKLYHLMHLPGMQDSSDVENPFYNNQIYLLYDFSKSTYVMMNKPDGPESQFNQPLMGVIKVPKYRANYFTPESMAGIGIR